VDPDFPEQIIPYFIAQYEINVGVREKILKKFQAELWVSLLQEWNLLEQGVKVSYRKSQQSLSSFFF